MGNVLGDSELRAIFLEHRPSVFRVCFRYVGSKQEAEDIAQEVFMVVFRKLPDFRGDCKLGTWIYRIAINRCLEHLRLKKRRNQLDVEAFHPAVLRNLSPDDDRILAKIDLEKILAGLKPNKRRILFLACAEGLSYDEISEVMGIGKSAVAKVVSRFKETMQASKWQAGKGLETKRRDNALG